MILFFWGGGGGGGGVGWGTDFNWKTMKEESHEEVGLLFYGSGMPTFWLGLILFIEGGSQIPIFKILVRTLKVCSRVTNGQNKTQNI